MRPISLLLYGLLGCNDYELSSLNGTNSEANDPPDQLVRDEGMFEWTGTDTGSGDPPLNETCEDAVRPDPYTVAIDPACIAEPSEGSFAPVVEWSWRSDAAVGGYENVMSTPAVGNLNDDNGDGVVDENDIPDIVFTAYGGGGSYSGAGAVHALSGDGSGLLWSVVSPGGAPTRASGGVALGDLEGDGQIEVCVLGQTASVVCLEGATGALRWASGSTSRSYGGPAIADLDADGTAEVIVGRQVFRSDGSTFWVGTLGTGGGSYPHSVPVDWDGDGLQELVAGNTVYDTDGTILLALPTILDGYPAIGDFDGDTLPDLVVASRGRVAVVTNDGVTLWQSDLPGGGGGPPTVADFDGDGLPEVGAAGAQYYSVFDTDGSLLWSTPTSDISSGITGSSVFDFDDDGDAEVVYADELTLWVFDGPTGAVKLEETNHASGTLLEYPVIADVDGDGSSEIVVASNNLYTAEWNGITVIGDADGTWAPSRPIWNQKAYSITNVNDDGTIPAAPIPNWTVWNSFRAAGSLNRLPGSRPDLALGQPELCLDDCDEGRVKFWIPGENTGIDDISSEVSVAIRRDEAGGPTITQDALRSLAAGTADVLGPFVLTQEEWGEGVWAVMDPDGRIDECDEEDNTIDLGAWPCP